MDDAEKARYHAEELKRREARDKRQRASDLKKDKEMIERMLNPPAPKTRQELQDETAQKRIEKAVKLAEGVRLVVKDARHHAMGG